MEKKIKNTVLKLWEGDITDFKVDAIVNAANNQWRMGGGVAAAIRRKGGQVIEDEARVQGTRPVGSAIITGAGKLPASYVIHAAVMGMDFNTDAAKIRLATVNTLLLADEKSVKALAFPAFGTGVGGFPMNETAEIMLTVTLNHINQGTEIETIYFVLYGTEAYRTFETEFNRLVK